MIKRIIAGALSAVLCTTAAATGVSENGLQAFSGFESADDTAILETGDVSEDDTVNETAPDPTADKTDSGEAASAARELINTIELGENISAEVYDDGYVLIKGYGDMNEFNSSPFKGMGIKDVRFENENEAEGLVITSIGKNTFNGCDTLSGLSGSDDMTAVMIAIPESIKSIGEYAFANCTGIKTLIVPANVKSMGRMIFNGCTELTELTLPYAATAATCAQTDGEVDPDCSVADLFIDQHWNWQNDRMDFSSYKLTKITITGGEKIPKCAFANMKNLTEIDLSGTAAEEIGENAFCDCTSLSDVKLPATLKKLGGKAFLNCTSINEFNLPNGLETIGEYAFANCTGISSVDIPDTIVSMGRMIFNGCTELTSLTLPYAATKAECVDFDGDVDPDCSVADLFIDQHWNWENNRMDFSGYKLTRITIKGGNRIPKYAFANMRTLTEVDLSGTPISTVDEHAFYNCTALADIKLPDYVHTIGDYAYSNTPITALPDNGRIKNIGNGAFADCKNLEITTLPASYCELGESVFQNCTGIKTFVVPETVYSMGRMTFNGCTELTELTLPYACRMKTSSIIKLTTDPDCSVADLFMNQHWNWSNDAMDFSDYKLYKITVTGGEKVPKYAFSHMTGLKEIDLSGSKAEIIDEHAFNDCTALETVKLPSTLKRIGYASFRNCTSVKNFDLPDGLEVIEEYAFVNCTGVNSLTIPETVTSMGRMMVNGCLALETLQLPYAATKAESVAVDGNVDPDSSVSDLFIDQHWNWENDSMDFSDYAISRIVITGGERIPKYAFSNMTTLKEVDICSSGVKTIDEAAFRKCSALVSAEIPESVESIGNSAFMGSSPDLYIYGKECELADNALNEDYSGKVYGYSGSSANTYADEKGFEFVPLDNELVIGAKTISLAVGDKYTIKTGVEGVTFSSADENVAAVDEMGVISAVSVGKTIVEAMSAIGESIKLDVTVRTYVTIVTTTTVTTTTAETTSTDAETTTTEAETTTTDVETTTTVTETIADTTTTVPVTTTVPSSYSLGDIDDNGKVNAVDASMILSEYASMSTKGVSELDDKQKKASDVNNDGKINAIDATTVLTYYAYISTHIGENISMEEFLEMDK